MDILNRIIAEMNKEDIRYFKLYSSRTKPAGERKDLQLFDYIRKKGNKYDEENIVKQLYGPSDKNSFYRLKNRLTEDLNKCLITQHSGKDELLHIYHLLSLVRFFFSKNNYRVALHFLKKAEGKAIKLENYELLDIIYGEYIKLSHESMSIDPEEFITKRKENNQQLHNLRQIDDILAAVSYRLKVTQNFSEKENPILELLEKTINDFSQDKAILKSAKLRFRIYSAVSQVLLQRHEYKALETYLLKTHKEFNKEELFNKANHNTKLQMLTYIINTLARNKKHELSLTYVDELKNAMEEHNQLLYDKYLFFYYNSLVINYYTLDKDKAISILEEAKENQQLSQTSFYGIFIYLNLAVLFFDQQQYRNAVKNLNTLYLHDSYKNADPSLQFKIGVAELLIRYELNDFDFLEYKIDQLKKDFKPQLKKKENAREKNLMEILKDMCVTTSIKKDKKLLSRVQKFLKDDHLDDAEIIKYNPWLSSKIG